MNRRDVLKGLAAVPVAAAVPAPAKHGLAFAVDTGSADSTVCWVTGYDPFTGKPALLSMHRLSDEVVRAWTAGGDL